MDPVTPGTKSFIWLTEHELNKIATEFYGSKYVAQQTGDMLPNDSYHRFIMDEDNVSEMNPRESWDGKQRTYLGYDRAKKETVYHMGHNPIDYWLSLSHSRDLDKQTHPSNPWEAEDCYGAVFAHDFQVYREAPEPQHVLADLILHGILPYGDYMMEVSW